MTGPVFPDQGAIRRAIETVFDPCSVNAGAPINVIDMGLILGWSIGADRRVDILMRLTSPGCTLAPSFMHRIEEAVAAVEHVEAVKVTVTGLLLWGEDDIAAGSLQRLKDIRRKSLSLAGARPQQWRTATPRPPLASAPAQV
jgi:metal-sulfur cluster biosynthetic enzyme